MGIIASVAGLGGIIQANLALNHILKLNLLEYENRDYGKCGEII